MTRDDIRRIRADLSPRGRHGRKDPSLRALAWTLLDEVERLTPSADPASPAGPGSTTTPARTSVVLHPAEDPPEVAIRRALTNDGSH